MTEENINFEKVVYYDLYSELYNKILAAKSLEERNKALNQLILLVELKAKK